MRARMGRGALSWTVAFFCVGATCAAWSCHQEAEEASVGRPSSDAPRTAEASGSGPGDQSDVWTWNPSGSPDSASWAGGPPARSAPSIVCDWPDPFAKYFQCSGACHFVLGQIEDVHPVTDGSVVEGTYNYVVSDINVGVFALEKDLTQTKPFKDGATTVKPVGSGKFEVEEVPHGFCDYYSKGPGSQEYQFTDSTNEKVVPEYAKLAAGQRVVLALDWPNNLLAPDRLQVRLLLPVSKNDEVDFSLLQGTSRMQVKDGDEAIDVPTGPVSVNVAQQFLEWLVDHNVTGKCAPSQPEPDDGTEAAE